MPAATGRGVQGGAGGGGGGRQHHRPHDTWVQEWAGFLLYVLSAQLGTRKGLGPVEAKLLLALETARGKPHAAAREVQGRLLAGLGQRGDRILASTFA